VLGADSQERIKGHVLPVAWCGNENRVQDLQVNHLVSKGVPPRVQAAEQTRLIWPLEEQLPVKFVLFEGLIGRECNVGMGLRKPWGVRPVVQQRCRAATLPDFGVLQRVLFLHPSAVGQTGQVLLVLLLLAFGGKILRTRVTAEATSRAEPQAASR